MRRLLSVSSLDWKLLPISEDKDYGFITDIRITVVSVYPYSISNPYPLGQNVLK